MRSSLFTLFLLSLEAAPATSLRIPLPLQSPSPRLADSSGKRIGARWTLDLKSGMGIEKRRKSHEGDTDLSGSGQQALDEDGGTGRARPDAGDEGERRKRPDKEEKADGDDVARIMEANDGGDDDDQEPNAEDEGEQPKGRKGGKKAKHIPGSHHRDDRIPPTEEQDTKHRPNHKGKHKGKGKGKHEKRYLSSNPRYHTKKELSFWDYDRHVKRMGEFDPLHGTGLREEVKMQKRGHGADERKGGRHGKGDRGRHRKGDDGGRHSKHDDGGRGRHGKHGDGDKHGRGGRGDGRKGRHDEDEDMSATDARGDDFLAAGQAEHVDRPHINAVGEGEKDKGQVRGDSLPDLHVQDHAPSHRQGVTPGDGVSAQSKSLASPAHHDKDTMPARGLLDPLRANDILGLDYDAYDCEEVLTYGHRTLLGRDEQDPSATGEQPPAPGPPTSVSVVDGGPRLYADRIIWQPKSDHPEKHGGLERRRKNKHHDGDEEDEDGGGRHGRNRHGDDEDEDDYGSSKGRHRGGDQEDDEYGSFSSKKGKGRYDDEEEEEDGYSAKSTGRTKGKGSFDEDDTPYSKSNPLSDFDDDEDAPLPKSKPKSKFDDGQYRPSTYANSGVDDCVTLSSFYTSMRGETWTPTSDWSGSAVSSKAAACCSWTGVTCDEFERVIGVDVSSLGLSGPLGNEVFSLDALLRLDISGNALTSLPDRFDTLPTLANINAASNNLTGPIPTTLLTHPTLKTLNLASNGFNGEIVINSVNLTSIALNKNQLTSVRVMEGSGLVKVDLADNKCQGLLPDLTSSPYLQIFDASNNNTGTLFDISGMTSLTRLDVRTNALSGPFPTSLSQLKRLTSLYLSYNAFTGPFPSEPAPPMLASCYVTPNPITPCPSPSELANANSLAAKCHASCPKVPGSGGGRGSGIPVSPLPGEAGTQPLYIDPHSSSYVLAPDTSSQPASVTTNSGVNQNAPPYQPAQGAAYNQPNVNVNNINTPVAAGLPPYNNNGMDASTNGISGTRQQQMVGAAVPVRANGAVRDSVRGTWITAGLASAAAPWILGFAV